MALIFLGVLIFFYRFKFRVSTSQIALTSLLMMSSPNSSNLSPLDYQVRGNAGVLKKLQQKPKTVPEFLNVL